MASIRAICELRWPQGHCVPAQGFAAGLLWKGFETYSQVLICTACNVFLPSAHPVMQSLRTGPTG